MNNAYLFIEDRKYSILHFDFNFYQLQGANLKPNGIPKLYPFTIVLKASRDNFLREWTTSPHMKKEGYIEIRDFSDTHINFKWEFANAYAVNQSFDFNDSNNLPLVSNLSITTGIIRINKEAVFENNWNPSNPFENQTMDRKNTLDKRIKTKPKLA